MNIEELRDHCLSLAGISEETPFGPDTVVYKLQNKIFLIAPLAGELSFSVKCYPEEGVSLREKYPAITPGFHLNKRHWITVRCNGSIPNAKLLEFINTSYTLVKSSLPRKLQGTHE